jgi:glycosyltransferase involved in cell wall biosynthesis
VRSLYLPLAPEVSVVIPVFNAAALIATALQSVFSQTFSDFEVIVVDDGSEDHGELRAALEPWAARITYLRQSNQGPASARNTGIAHATGRFVAFLDADDEWRPQKLARQVAYFAQYPETGLLHTGVSGELRPPATVAGPPRALFCDLFHSAFFINTLTVMIPRQVIADIGGFDERREIHIEDYDLWLRIAARYPIGYIPEPLAYHRPGGLMSSQMERTYAAQALVMEKNEALCLVACAAHRASPGRCKRARRHVLHRDWGYDRLQVGDCRGAREQLRRAVACSPFDAYTVALYLATFLSHGWFARVRRLSWRRATSTRGDGSRLSTSPMAKAGS